jgi:dynein heavy chain 1
VEKFVNDQKLLSHNRYQYPKSWLYAENVEGEWSALLEILNRKDAAIQAQVSEWDNTWRRIFHHEGL